MLLLAACSGGSASPTSGPTSSAATSSAAPTTSSAPAAAWLVNNCATGAIEAGEENPLPVPEGVTGIGVSPGVDAPSISVGEGLAPATSLVAVDLVVGKGDAVPAEGATVAVQYCGVGQTTRTLFDASWLRGQPAQFPLSGVIAGWTEGIPGMKPGGRRILVIPGDLAYGPAGNPPAILPDETLIFVVDLIDWVK